MNGRVYDYNLGRFLSVDPFIQEAGNSQSINPYSYIMNNPLAGTDPTGYIGCAASRLKSRCEGTLSHWGGNGQADSEFFNSGNSGQVSLSNGASQRDNSVKSNVQTTDLNEEVDSGTSENQTPDLRVTQQEQDWAEEGNLASLYKSRALKGEGNVANVGLGVWGSFEDNVEVHGFLGALYWKSFVGTLTKLNSYASLSDGAAYLPFLDGADAKIMLAHIHNKPMAIRIAQEHLKAVRNDFKYDTKGVPGRLSEAQITTYHHAVFKEFNANTRFYGGTLFTGESNGNFAKAWKWSLSWAYCGLSCDSN